MKMTVQNQPQHFYDCFLHFSISRQMARGCMHKRIRPQRPLTIFNDLPSTTWEESCHLQPNNQTNNLSIESRSDYVIDRQLAHGSPLLNHCCHFWSWLSEVNYSCLLRLAFERIISLFIFLLREGTKHPWLQLINRPKLGHQSRLRPGSNVHNIPGIFQNLFHKSAAAHWQNIQWNIPLYAAVCYVFFSFFMEYSVNILQVRLHPKCLRKKVASNWNV